MTNSILPKLIASGALIFNEEGKFLLLETSYKTIWEIPGGLVESDESPLEACKREISEEIGLKLNIKNLLSVVHCRKQNNKMDSLQFIFDGGILSKSEIFEIKPDMIEIINYRFVTLEEAKDLTSEKLVSRIKHAILNRNINQNSFIDFDKID